MVHSPADGHPWLELGDNPTGKKRARAGDDEPPPGGSGAGGAGGAAGSGSQAAPPSEGGAGGSADDADAAPADELCAMDADSDAAQSAAEAAQAAALEAELEATKRAAATAAQTAAAAAADAAQAAEHSCSLVNADKAAADEAAAAASATAAADAEAERLAAEAEARRADAMQSALTAALAATAAFAGVISESTRRRRQHATDPLRTPWDGDAFMDPGSPPAHATAEDAAAAAAARQLGKDARVFGALHKHAREQLRAVEKRYFYFMKHTGFSSSRWLKQLCLDEGVLQNAGGELQLVETAAGGAPVSTSCVLVTFGVASHPPKKRLQEEFFQDVPAAFGYAFRCADSITIPWWGAAGGSFSADVDGGEAETPLKALLKAAGKRHSRGVALRKALRAAGIMPFDHPACAFEGAAPDGIMDETMLVSAATWDRLKQCDCTADLKAWVMELVGLQRNVDVAAADAAGHPHRRC